MKNISVFSMCEKDDYEDSELINYENERKHMTHKTKPKIMKTRENSIRFIISSLLKHQCLLCV